MHRGTYEVDVVFEQGPTPSGIDSFQGAMTYDQTKFMTPTCTVDPENFFNDDIMPPECPATYQSDLYIDLGAAGEKNPSTPTAWPSGNPNFRLMRISFANIDPTIETTPAP